MEIDVYILGLDHRLLRLHILCLNCIYYILVVGIVFWEIGRVIICFAVVLRIRDQVSGDGK